MKHALLSLLMMISTASICCAAGKLELNSEKDKLNYSVGYQIGGDFKKQGVELNPEALVQGIRDALAKTSPLMTQEEMNTTLADLKKNIAAVQQGVEKRAAAEYRKASAEFLRENAKQSGVTVLPSGVQYKVLKAGSGKKPTLKDEVKVHYRITKIDGKEVASTYVGGKPRTYPMAKAMPGLQEILLLMSEGSKWQIALPTGTASGGREPLDDIGVMIYEMELLAVVPAKQTAPETTQKEMQDGEQSPLFQKGDMK